MSKKPIITGFTTKTEHVPLSGVTLRDIFAGFVLLGAIASSESDAFEDCSDDFMMERDCAWAYNVADCMLKVRAELESREN